MVAPFLNIKGIAFAMAEFGLADGRPAPRLVAGVDVDAAKVLEAEEASIERLDALQAAWADLAARALEPNAFYEPGFALSAARHFPVSERPRFIVVKNGAGRMMGLFPIVAANPLTGDGLTRLWLHKQAALATPLVDRDMAAETIEAFLEWMEARGKSTGVVFARMPADGKFRRALERAATSGARRLKILDSYERAALLPGGDADELCARAGSKKKLADMRRQARRLREMGRLTFESHETPEDVRVAAEEFMALEAAGWKAGRGAFLSEPALATFLRSATRLLAAEKRCRIQSLRLNGKPIAMAIVLESQGRSYCWKIAFDESLRSQAPGVQLVYEQTKAHLQRGDLEYADSCAIANHPMIDKLWPDRIGVCDLAVSLRARRERDFLSSCRRDHARRQIRELAKRAASRLLKRKVS
ncbi:GNAT family N-acetyltransferase [Methylocystis parvus]|uniref:GNAT family N-acetyltransferase n=1 Tax=Methylocystis parvus TaxID=134 RepID=A0A6B8MA55_9HYPH|nr:GNAT family N-acetyltransferase [Methylocystis parvus]QGM99566.1 GNAT family N-acetyltransferase [Methylocystis parvus]WBK02108.1 GNAT family N-acetyltransferase [Methylocystis parvus OBBP]